MFNLEEVRLDQKKRTVSVFVVDKCSRKIKPVKDMVLRQLSSLGVKVQAIIAGSSYAFWDVLLPTEEEAVALTRKTLENKEYFFPDGVYGATADHGLSIRGPQLPERREFSRIYAKFRRHRLGNP